MDVDEPDGPVRTSVLLALCVLSLTADAALLRSKQSPKAAAAAPAIVMNDPRIPRAVAPVGFITNSFPVTWNHSGTALAPSSVAAGFFVYYGPASRFYTNRWESSSNVFRVKLVRPRGSTIPDTWLAVTAYNALGAESDYSNELVWPRKFTALDLSWGSVPATVTIQLTTDLRRFTDLTTITGTNILISLADLPPAGAFRLKNPSGTNALTLSIRLR